MRYANISALKKHRRKSTVGYQINRNKEPLNPAAAKSSFDWGVALSGNLKKDIKPICKSQIGDGIAPINKQTSPNVA